MTYAARASWSAISKPCLVIGNKNKKANKEQMKKIRNKDRATAIGFVIVGSLRFQNNDIRLQSCGGAEIRVDTNRHLTWLSATGEHLRDSGDGEQSRLDALTSKVEQRVAIFHPGDLRKHDEATYSREIL